MERVVSWLTLKFHEVRPDSMHWCIAVLQVEKGATVMK